MPTLKLSMLTITEIAAMRTTPTTHTLVIIPARAPIDSLLNLSPLLTKDSVVDLMGATQSGRVWAVKE